MSILSDIVGDGISNTISSVGDVIYKGDSIKADIVKTEINADTQIALAQNVTNNTEAGSDDKFTKRWRPTLGYICSFGFGYQFVLQPFLILLVKLNHIDIVMPQLDMTSISSLLVVLIGARSYDKYQQMK